jgi:FixJ family two-component response regulator/DNA-binding winged helix-turn-helix (wHTH) protein
MLNDVDTTWQFLRTVPKDGGLFEFAEFQLVPASRTLSRDGRLVALGCRAFDILVALVERAGRVVSKAELVSIVWSDTHIDESALRVHIAALRKALGDGLSGNRFIVNVRGRGYAFVAGLSRLSGGANGAGPPTTEVRSGRDRLTAPFAGAIAQERISSGILNSRSNNPMIDSDGAEGTGRMAIRSAVHGEPGSACRDRACIEHEFLRPDYRAAAGRSFESHCSSVNEPIVHIVDDDPSLRELLSSLFRSVGLQGRLYGSAAELLESRLPDAPSCLVLDVRLPGLSGLELQTELARANIRIPIIFMTGHADVQMTVRAMKGGAVDFLTKPFRDQELLDAVSTALDLDQKRRQEEGYVSGLRARFESLTSRERELMALVTTGLLNKQMAAEMGVSEIMVKVHRSNVMKKMRAKSLADLVKFAEKLALGSAKQ